MWATDQRQVLEAIRNFYEAMFPLRSAFELPDGKKLTVSAATRVAMAEPLFDPSMLGQAGGGLAQLVAECIRQRDRDGVLESTEHGKDGTPL